MNDLTAAGRQKLEALAQRHGVGMDAAMTLLRAISHGGGAMAQFSHPELGGMGQWSPGMTMVGDMFNSGLKGRVEALSADLAAMLREGGNFAQSSSEHAGAAPEQVQGGSETGHAFAGGAWWPASLGSPGSSGGQNDMRYAYFPSSRRLAVQQGGRVSLYDTGDAEVHGASQQQGGSQSLSFSTSRGNRQLRDFTPVEEESRRQQQSQPQPAPRGAAHTDTLAAIAGLADLHAKGVLTQEEFASKKAELLSRL